MLGTRRRLRFEKDLAESNQSFLTKPVLQRGHMILETAVDRFVHLASHGFAIGF